MNDIDYEVNYAKEKLEKLKAVQIGLSEDWRVSLDGLTLSGPDGSSFNLKDGQVYGTDFGSKYYGIQYEVIFALAKLINGSKGDNF